MKRQSDRAVRAELAFTLKQKDRWLREVSCNQNLYRLSIRVAVYLSGYFSRTGAAFPSQLTIKDAVGASREGVRQALMQLSREHHLLIIPGLGRGNVTRYIACFPSDAQSRAEWPKRESIDERFNLDEKDYQ